MPYGCQQVIRKNLIRINGSTRVIRNTNCNCRYITRSRRFVRRPIQIQAWRRRPKGARQANRSRRCRQISHNNPWPVRSPDRSYGSANLGRAKSIRAGTALQLERLERTAPGVTDEMATAAGGVDHLCLAVLSSTSMLQSPGYIDNNKFTTTPHQFPQEKYASMESNIQADRKPDTGETTVLQCDCTTEYPQLFRKQPTASD